MAGPVTNSGVAVSNGLFTVAVDFGAGAFTGQACWLQIAVETNGGESFTTLYPSNPVLPTPYSIYAANAGNAATAGSVAASNITGTLSAGQYPV